LTAVLDASPPAARSSSSWWGVVAAVTVVTLALLAGLEVAGRGARRMGPSAPVARGGAEVALVRDGAEALGAWRSRGFQGRVVVHVGRFLHFVEPVEPGRLGRSELQRIGAGRIVVEEVARQVDDVGYLWAAAQAGVARRIAYVEPPGSFRARAAALEQAGDGALDLQLRGFPREARLALPSVSEPVLLDVAASWFDEGTGEELSRMLEASGLRADLVTLNLLEGSADVSDAARGRLRAFAERIAPEGRR
jgi:hypothetical protein